MFDSGELRLVCRRDYLLRIRVVCQRHLTHTTTRRPTVNVKYYLLFCRDYRVVKVIREIISDTGTTLT